MYPDSFATVYGGWHGIEGILKEELLDLSAQSEEEVRYLRTTPSAGSIGTCRYKLKSHQAEDFERVIQVLRAHDVGYFFYIGGNDSMDTADKVARLAHQKGLDLIAVGVAKTIDNDVGDPEFQRVDHTPGYGSVARYWACNIQNINEENNGISRSDPVMVVQVMGRKTGFIPAAVRLGDPNREMPLQIYMPESGLSIDDMTDSVNDQLKADGRVIVVMSEGFEAGELGDRRDSFGHTKFSASRITAQQLVVNHLNKAGLAARGVARGQIAGIDQRATIIYASTVDLDEAYKVGENAVRIAVENGSGFMSTIIRAPGSVYRVAFDKVPLDVVANSEREFPTEWISPNRVDVTDEYVRYARPLIGDDWVSVPLVGGIQRFARLQAIFADQKLPAYVPVEHRN